MKQETKPSILIQVYKFILRRLSLQKGTGFLASNKMLVSQCQKYKDDVVAELLSGIKLKVNLDDYNGRRVYLFGTNDLKVHKVTQALLSPGDVFLDIGANYGSIGLCAIDQVGSEGSVHLFEPQPNLCSSMEEAIQKAGISNVHLHKVGLMDKAGSMQLKIPNRHRYGGGHSGGASFLDEFSDSSWESFEVPVVEASEYLKPILGTASFGVKLDVEGAETCLMPHLIALQNLKFLIFESVRNRKQLWNFFENSPLALYGLKNGFFEESIYHIPSYETFVKFDNVIAVRLREGLELSERINPLKLGKLLQGSL